VAQLVSIVAVVAWTGIASMVVFVVLPKRLIKRDQED
jgi:hypothetical protein